MARHRTFGIVILALVGFLSEPASSVDRSKFKTCHQSGFCRRARAVEPGHTAYYVDMTTVTASATMIEAVMVNQKVQSNALSLLSSQSFIVAMRFGHA